MTAQEIRKEGQLIKDWWEKDGEWYSYHLKVYKVGNRYYMLQDHLGVSFACTREWKNRVIDLGENPEL